MKTSLTLLAGPDDSGDSHPLVSALASNDAIADEWRWDVVAYVLGGPSSSVSGRFAAMAGWDVFESLEAADLVHVFSPFTRAGEVAALAAKALGKPLALSGLVLRQSELGRSLGIVELADVLILENPDELTGPTSQPTFVLDASTEDALSWLSDIYDETVYEKVRLP